MSGDAPIHESPGLTGIRRVDVPGEVVDRMQQFLRSAGQRGDEAVAFWVGRVDGSVFRVRGVLIPQQQAVRTPAGEVAVVVAGDELHRMNVWLYRNSLLMVAQIHSHPGEAYHSETDDSFAVMTRVGGLSIVVPDFAVRDFSLSEVAVYRLSESGRWVRLSDGESAALIHIEPQRG